MDADVKKRLIESYLATSPMRAKLAASMVKPMALRMAYQGLWSKVLHLSGGWEAVDRVEIQKERVRALLPDWVAVERAQGKIVPELNKLLNTKLLDTFRSFSAPVKMKSWDDIPKCTPDKRSRLLMNVRDYADLRKTHHGYLDEMCSREILRSGLMADFRNNQILVSCVVERGTIYHLGYPESVGTLWSELDVLPVENDLVFAVDVVANYQIEMANDPDITVFVR